MPKGERRRSCTSNSVRSPSDTPGSRSAADDHDARVGRFVRLDRLAVAAAPARLRSTLLAHPLRPRAGGDGPKNSELGVVRKQAALKRRHLPVRRLFAAVPTVLPRLKPCVMMSPLAVSTYLGASDLTFDVVIFDEASHLRPHDAICAVYRGRQLVVAGDPRQLPPSDFFARSTADDPDADDDDEGTAGFESLLNVCLSLGLVHKRLRWHYRSRREGLIAFSNRYFYEGGLVTFPGADDAAEPDLREDRRRARVRDPLDGPGGGRGVRGDGPGRPVPGGGPPAGVPAARGPDRGPDQGVAGRPGPGAEVGAAGRRPLGRRRLTDSRRRTPGSPDVEGCPLRGGEHVGLFSYRVRFDHGSAPNPFWGVCTLVICKPRVRRRARVGDWVVGTGSAHTPAGDLSGAVVYAMQVTRTLSRAGYDAWSARHPRKRPDPSHPDPRQAFGDSIYDFSTDPPMVRPGVHTEAHRAHDLSGRRALLSRRFVYFGRRAEPLPPHLLGVVKDGPGHRSASITHLEQPFVEWLESLGHRWGSVLAAPSGWPDGTDLPAPGC